MNIKILYTLYIINAFLVLIKQQSISKYEKKISKLKAWGGRGLFYKLDK